MIYSFLNTMDPLHIAGICGILGPVSIVGTMYFTCRAFLLGEF